MLARRIAVLGPMLVSLACAGANPPAAAGDGDLPRADPGVLYAIGASLGAQVKDYRLDEDEAREVARGLLDKSLRRPYAGVMTEETSDQVGQFHERRLQELARREELEGAPALEQALRVPGAVKTESGMVLQVIEPGSGASPTIFDYVTINYHGMLRDGKVFYSNRGEAPYRVQLGTTTRCWQEALTAVAPGARVHVVCPPALNYGWGGWPGVVPGGAVLIYDLELLSVEKS
ncbi:MAG: hypothetical protein E6J87_15725 [Deltaproteobacteria bacterium]|nr:MAG: hypothetical protein E6J87_15725 [Deltaproteobacteria bacterium]